jgi:hypothetical protein
MELNRKPTVQELKLIELLVEKASINLSSNWRDELTVKNMDDGQMGSLRLYPDRDIIKKRIFDKCVSEYQFNDIDGILVIASLYIDSENKLFELDIWKTNYEPLKRLPFD